MQEPEKSWHFDPVTERSSALAANPDADYLLLDAIQKAIAFYQHCPVSGYEIAKVEVIYNRGFNIDFNSQLRRLQHKKGNSAFIVKKLLQERIMGEEVNYKKMDIYTIMSSGH